MYYLPCCCKSHTFLPHILYPPNGFGSRSSLTSLGLTEGTWKQRNYQHKHTFNNRKQEHRTSLSKFVWSTKDKNNNAPPKISRSILKLAPAYSNTTKRCMLCLQEKLAIITYPEQHKLLNKRSELISKCRHENKFLLRYYDSKD